MLYATVDSLAAEISRRLDERLEKESNADVATANYEQAGALLKNALEQGLEGLLEKGRYRGIYLCGLEITEVPVSFTLKGIDRVATIPSFKLILGDEAYEITPTINALIGTITYAVSNRSLSFVCRTLPTGVDLMINPQSGREFTAARALEFVGMLLNGKN
ncbi:hypothetical protein [Pseudomonas sp. RW3S2]|uniref:hypothetical protein n=1 Tax=Pseudomonas sp. RW3S2 TaxID=485884 RepID=UPI0016457A68|nr:hypothetical protein [Pseudomonas sp. RW3S2]MBC3419996.1 hypothetical protein [Pseudomonas sp. RW3S2]